MYLSIYLSIYPPLAARPQYLMGLENPNRGKCSTNTKQLREKTRTSDPATARVTAPLSNTSIDGIALIGLKTF